MPGEEKKDYVKVNEKAWDEVTPVHSRYRSGEARFFSEGGSMLDSTETAFLPDLAGKRVAHLCCNCGQDTLSLANMGAVCTGFDQSGKAIVEARRLSHQSGVKAEFIKADVMDLPIDFHGVFDFVYLSRGVLVWIPDLLKLMRNAALLLRKGGQIFIYDQHPFVHMLDLESDQPGKVVHDYFSTEPHQYSGLDYIGGSQYDASPNYQFMVRLGDLIGGLSKAGMRLTGLHEFSHSITDSMLEQFRKAGNPISHAAETEKDPHPRMPMMMLLTAIKE